MKSRRTKIICTLGPASRRKETITKMAKAGMDMVRLNFSHGTHEQHQKLIDTVREVNDHGGYKIKILQDLEGYRIRIGHIKHAIQLIKHQQIWLVKGSHEKGNHIPLESCIDLSLIKKGMEVFIADGMIALKVLERSKKKIKMEVIHGGPLGSRKGVNIPELKLKPNIVTEKDKKDIEFGIKNKVDFIAQSFVRHKQDILRVKKIVQSKLPKCRVFAKIENQQGVGNIDGIIDSCDGIMVARGDLGVSLPIYRIPIVQKDIIQRCNRKKKCVVTATQMLESMTDNPRPTRAEVSDVANAILDGTNYVMLSGETAAGSYPVKSVRMMCQIIEYTEQNRLKKG